MAIYKRGKFYWYKFMWNGELLRESTRQGNDKKARNMESDHRARLAREEQEREAACERFACSEVLRCHECEKLFNAEKAIRDGSSVFCSDACASAWGKKHTRIPTLAEFLDERFEPWAKATFSRRSSGMRPGAWRLASRSWMPCGPIWDPHWAPCARATATFTAAGPGRVPW